MTTNPVGATNIVGHSGRRIDLTSAQLDAFTSNFRGPILRPGDEGWEEAVLIWNGMAARLPSLVLRPTSTEDVAGAVAFARDNGLLLSIKGGGHNIGGTAVAEGGLMLDMSSMRTVTVDPVAKLAQVGPGCLLRDVDRATQAYGLATVLGFISEVGVAGLTLGGGLGYLTRRFGWTVDNLEEVEIVTADGNVHVASRSENSDLFWAVRGAGANFGVVTRFTYRLHEVGPTVYGGLVAWPFERVDEVQDAYRAITAIAPRELSVWMVLLNAPPAPFVPVEWQGRRICAMVVCYSGDLGRVDGVLAPLRALGEPIVDLLQEWPYTQQQSFLDNTEPKGAHYYWKTEFAAELSDGLLSTLRDVFASCPMPEGQVGILHLAGALNDYAMDDGAVGNRDAKFAIGVNGMWEPGAPNADEYLAWVQAGGKRIRPYSSGGNYINFQTADEDDQRVRATYGANYERLVRIKAKYDPDNVFRVNRNIRNTSESSTRP